MFRFALLFSLVLLSSCLREVSVVIRDVDPLSWNADQPVEICMENTDTLHVLNIDVLARYTSAFTKPSMPLQIRTFTPDSLCVAELFTIPADHSFRKPGDVSELRATYRSQVRLSRVGTYRFIITPAPGINTISGVMAVGLDFRKN